ncbi:MAG: CCA tRNA nucleotidyltransferase [Magnetococcales bacterium]|nr:CCA tRNA nucleotidyltransferase [Magnetococcales bacterium]
MSKSFNNSLPQFLQTMLDDLNHIIGPIYLVGGAVRNGLQNKPPTNDLNILVARSLSECKQLLNENGYLPSIATTRHNVLFLPLKGCEKPKTIEISTIRHRPEQKPTVEEDLLQRDITVNAMAYLWPNGPIIDPFKGQEDLNNRRIKLVNGAQTLKDDPLRALRFFRFALQLSFRPESYDLARSSETILKDVTADRLRVELDRILSFPLRTDHDRKLFRYMLNTTMGTHLLPQLDQLKIIIDSGNPSQTLWERTIRSILSFTSIPNNEELSLLDLRWSALFIGISSTYGEREQLFSSAGLKTPQEESPVCCKQILESFCFSKRRHKRISNLLHHLSLDSTPSDKVLKRLLNDSIPLEGLYRLNSAWSQAGIPEDDNFPEKRRKVEARLFDILASCKNIRKAIKRPRTNELALSGGDILNIVRKRPGPWLGKLQNMLVDYIDHDPGRNRVEVLERKIHKWILEQEVI